MVCPDPADVQLNELPAANDRVSDAVAMSFVQCGQSVTPVGKGQRLSGVVAIECSLLSVAGAVINVSRAHTTLRLRVAAHEQTGG